MQITKIKTKLEEKIRALEGEKATLLEEIRELKEVAELSERATLLENEVDKLREELKTLKDKIPLELMKEAEGETETHEKTSVYKEEKPEEDIPCDW